MSVRSQTKLDWSGQLDLRNRLRASLLDDYVVIEDIARLSDVDVQRVLIASRVPGRNVEMISAAQEAASTGAAAVLSARVSRGEIVLKSIDGENRRVRTDGEPVGPFAWLNAVCCALLARDHAVLEILCSSRNIAASQLSTAEARALGRFFCGAVAQVIVRPAAAQPWITQAEAMLVRERRPGEDEIVRQSMRALMPVLRALSTGDQDFNRALYMALDAHRDYFARRRDAEDPHGLLSLHAAAFAALGSDRLRTFDLDDLPEDPVLGHFRREPIDLLIEYGPRRTQREDDAGAFLDLEGYPREGRERSAAERDGVAVARYELPAGRGLPRTRIDFALPVAQGQPVGVSGAWPVALDPGERLQLADTYADRADAVLAHDPEQEARAWLTRAADQVQAVIDGIALAADTVADEAFTSIRGRALHDVEPGRFSRAALTEYRDMLTARIAGVAFDALGAEPRRDAGMMPSADALEAGLRPLLLDLIGTDAASVRSLLQPRPEDYDKVFEGAAVDAAREAFGNLWRGGIEMRSPTARQSALAIHAAPAGMLGADNELSRPFPGGYRALAPWLNPQRLWIAWKYVRPGAQGGLAYDGLVWCDDHWSWFPNPYRALRSFIRRKR